MNTPTSDAVVLFDKDIKKIVTWYSKLLGFPPNWMGTDYAYIVVDKTRIGFRTSVNGSRSRNVIYLNVASLTEKINIVEKMNGSVHEEPTQTTLGEYSCVMLDPFGNRFGLTSWLK